MLFSLAFGLNGGDKGRTALKITDNAIITPIFLILELDCPYHWKI
jgi:hypothetical protein